MTATPTRARRGRMKPPVQAPLNWSVPGLLAGVDEAGRGPLAGPVVAAAVMLDDLQPIRGLADSKLLSPRRREQLYGLAEKLHKGPVALFGGSLGEGKR